MVKDNFAVCGVIKMEKSTQVMDGNSSSFIHILFDEGQSAPADCFLMDFEFGVWSDENSEMWVETPTAGV